MPCKLWTIVILGIFHCTLAPSPIFAAGDETGEVVEVTRDANSAGGGNTPGCDECQECKTQKGKDKEKDKLKLPPWQYRPNWLVEGEFSGELEFRYSKESFKDSTAAYSREYGAYLGYRMRPFDDWTIQFGFKTGRDNRPTTSWIPAENLGDSQFLYFKEYWVRHIRKLGKSGELRFQAGRFDYPFDLTQIVFDNDLYIPGGYIERRWKVDGNSSFKRVSLGLYAAQLRDRKEGDRGSAFLGATRLGLRWENGDDSRVDAALSYLDFSNVDVMGRAIADSGWRVGGVTGGGETTNYWDGLGDLESGYRLVDLFAKGQWLRRSAWPVELEVEFVKNLAASGAGSGEDSAWFAGASIGPNNDPGDLQISVERLLIESDAVLANVNRGEYATNYESTQVQARYIPCENLEWKAVYRWSNSIADRGEALAFDDEELKLYFTISW